MNSNGSAMAKAVVLFFLKDGLVYMGKMIKNWAIICLIFLILCGCGKENINAATNYNMFSRDETNISIAQEERAKKIEVLAVNQDYMLYKVDYLKKEADFELEHKFFLYNLYLNETKEILSEDDVEIDIYNARLGENGRIFLWGAYGEIVIINVSGEMEKILHIDEIMSELDDKKDYSMMDVYDLVMKNGLIYVCGYGESDYLCILDSDYRGQFMKTGNDFMILSSIQEGVKLCDLQKRETYVFNPEKNILIKQENNGLSYDELSSVELMAGNQEYDFFYIQDDYEQEVSDGGTNLIGVKNEKKNKIFNFKAMNIKPEKVRGRGIQDDGQGGFWVITQAIDGIRLTVIHLMKDNQENEYFVADERQVIRIGGMSIPNAVEKLAYAFNENSEKYRVEIINYVDQYGDYNDALTHFNIDLLKGDVLDGVSLVGVDHQNLAEKGVLQDLNAYFEREEVDKSRFTQSFFKNITNKNGNIYYIFPNYIVSGLGYSEKIDFSDLTPYTEMIEDRKLFWGGELETVFTKILQYSGTRYIDEENKELHINTTDFQSLLELYKKQKSVKVSGVEPNILYSRGEAFSVDVQYLYPTWYFYYEKLLGEDTEITMPGTDGPIVDAMTFLLGVSAKSGKKEGMYQFIDYMYSPYVYASYFKYGGFPVLEFMWEEWKTFLMAEEPYVDQFGMSHLVSDFVMGFDEAERIIKKGSITAEAFEEMRTVMESATCLDPLPHKYIVIILEEANSYAEGQKSMEETCRILEGRIKNALEE